jgi:hypothetical protein
LRLISQAPLTMALGALSFGSQVFKEHRAPVEGAGDIHRRNLRWHDGARFSRDNAEKKGQVIGLDEWAGTRRVETWTDEPFENYSNSVIRVD